MSLSDIIGCKLEKVLLPLRVCFFMPMPNNGHCNMVGSSTEMFVFDVLMSYRGVSTVSAQVHLAQRSPCGNKEWLGLPRCCSC